MCPFSVILTLIELRSCPFSSSCCVHPETHISIIVSHCLKHHHLHCVSVDKSLDTICVIHIQHLSMYGHTILVVTTQFECINLIPIKYKYEYIVHYQQKLEFCPCSGPKFEKKTLPYKNRILTYKYERIGPFTSSFDRRLF